MSKPSTGDARQRAGRTRQQAGNHQGAEPPLPHERDESAPDKGQQATGGLGTGAAGQQQKAHMEQAREDLESGQVDTDMRATPGLDAARREEITRRTP